MAQVEEYYEEDDYEDEEGEGDEGEEDDDYEEVDAEELAAGSTAEGDEAPSASAPAQAAGGQEDGDDEDDEDEEEEEEEEEQAAPWNGLNSFAEKQDIVTLLKDLVAAGKKQVTILLLGKSGVGKSSLINSLLRETVVRVAAFKLQAETEITTAVARQVTMGDPEVDGFKLKIIDTCGVEEADAGDTVSYANLQKIAEDVKGLPIDVVAYVDRLDLYRVEPLDKAIFEAISRTFGRQIWSKAVLVLTHANMAQPPPGTTYDSFVDRRIKLLRRAIRRGPFFRPQLPAALVENSDACPVNGRGARKLPDDSEYLVDFFAAVVDAALSRAPYKYHPRLTYHPNRRYRWLLPLVLAGQFLFYKHVLLEAVQHDERLEAQAMDDYWKYRSEERLAVGLHAPSRPDKKTEWRLEQMYDDE